MSDNDDDNVEPPSSEMLEEMLGSNFILDDDSCDVVDDNFVQPPTIEMFKEIFGAGFIDSESDTCTCTFRFSIASIFDSSRSLPVSSPNSRSLSMYIDSISSEKDSTCLLAWESCAF